MDLRQLRHFVAAVRCGTLNRAAAEQHISQPAVTRSIKNLEKDLGGMLLERRPRGVVPTAMGRALYERAMTILGESDRAQRELRALGAGARGTVALGVGESFRDCLMTPATRRILGSGKRIDLRIVEGMFESLVPMLRRGEIEFLFTIFPSFQQETALRFEPLVAVRSGLVVRREHPLADVAVSRRQLSSAGWAVLEQEHALRFHEVYFTRSRLPVPPFRVRTGSVGALRSAVLGADLVALLPDHCVQDALDDGRLVRVRCEHALLPGRGGLVFVDERPLSAAAEKVAAEIRAVCAAADGRAGLWPAEAAPASVAPALPAIPAAVPPPRRRGRNGARTAPTYTTS